MTNIKGLAIFAGITLCAAMVVFILTASPIMAILGTLVIAVSMLGFAATATTYVMEQSVAALALRNDGFRFH